MPNDLTPARLRALIAAAAPGPWTMDVKVSYDSESVEVAVSIPEISKTQRLTDEQLSDWENQLPNVRLLEGLVNNAPALADALETARLLEWALSKGMVSYYDSRFYKDRVVVTNIDALRAAKEAADA